MDMRNCLAALIVVAMALTGVSPAGADVITDANAGAADIASKAPGTPPAVRVMAFVQVSVFEAVNAITTRYPSLQAKVNAPAGSSVDAAVAAATRTALMKLMPSQQAAIDADYERALKLVPDGPAKSNGIAVGERPRRHVWPVSMRRRAFRTRIVRTRHPVSTCRPRFRRSPTGARGSPGS